MKCEDVKPLMTQYLLGDLDEAGAAEVRAHVASCGGCLAYMQRIEPTLDLLRDALAAPSIAPQHLSMDRHVEITAKVTSRSGKLLRWFTVEHRLLSQVAAVFVFGSIIVSMLLPSFFGARKYAVLGDAVECVMDLKAVRPGAPAVSAPGTMSQGVILDNLAAEEKPSGARDESGVAPSKSFADGFEALPADRRLAPQSDAAAMPQPASEDKSFDLAARIKKPKPMFIGTPTNMKNVNLDPVRKDMAGGNYDERQVAVGNEVAAAQTVPQSEKKQQTTFAQFKDMLDSDSGAGAGVGGMILEKSKADKRSSLIDSEMDSRKSASLKMAAAADEFRAGAKSTSGAVNRGQAVSSREIVLASKGFNGIVEELGLPASPVASPKVEKLREEARAPIVKSEITASAERQAVPARDATVDLKEHVDQLKTLASTSSTQASGGKGVVNAPSEGERRDEAELAKKKEEAKEEDKSGPRFKAYGVNPFVSAAEKAFSTFSISCDSASYTLARNYMNRGSLPPAESVRTEEFVNFFDYAYKAPDRDTFKVYVECAPSKFGRGGLQMMKIGVKGHRLGREEQRRAVLTFLVDTSGSMELPDRIGLTKKSLRMLVEKLNPQDLVSIVKYDSHARIVLEHVPAAEKQRILDAIDSLQCSGSTNLEEGMERAYQIAARNFVSKGENRVLLLSDGVANLGNMAAKDILSKVEMYRKQGIFCSVFGLGMGTYDDTMLQELASKGDGVYKFLDSEAEAKSVFVDDLAANLNTIAKDVKIQVEFNPKRINRYRQVGYESRQLKTEDFRNDKIDAGEVGSGQSVTALYEMEIAAKVQRHKGTEVRDQKSEVGNLRADNKDDVIATVRVRYQRVDNGKIEEIERKVTSADMVQSFDQADVRFRLAVCAAEFAEILRGSPFADGREFQDVARVLAPVALELNLDGRVREFNKLVNGANGLSRGQ